MPDYPTTDGGVVAILADPRSAPSRSFVGIGPQIGYPDTEGGQFDLDSSNTVCARITNFQQRSGQNAGDIIGKIYNSSGLPITLSKVYYSGLLAGPWKEGTIVLTDPLFSFPAIGGPGGTYFRVPFLLPDLIFTNIYVKIEVTF